EPGGLDHDVHLEVLPRQLGRVALGQALDGGAGYLDALVGVPDGLRQYAEDAVVLEQMRHGGDVAEVVERDDLDVVPALLRGAPEVAADPAEAVDANSDGHPGLLCRTPGGQRTAWPLDTADPNRSCRQE